MIDIKFDEYESYCREQLGLSEHSIRAYQQDLRSFKKFAHNIKLEETPTSDHLVKYHKHLRERMTASAATIRRRFTTLRSYFKWLQQEQRGNQSPFEGLRLDLKVPRHLPRPVDRPTLNLLLRSSRRLVEINLGAASAVESASSSEQITGLVTRLLIVTGMRIGEITDLRIQDVTSACTRIRVRGKGNRERIVYVTNNRLLQDLKFYWETRIRNDDASGFLFLNSRNEQLTAPAFRKRLRTLSNFLLIEPYLTPHRFRHSAATLLIEEGVDIRIVQRLLGHASISTTEIYTKVSDNSLVAAIERADTLAQVDPL